MTAVTDGLAGAGTKEDPWLIGDSTQLAAVLRDTYGTGYFKLTGNCTYTWSDGGMSGNALSSARSKIIDACGYFISLTVSPCGSYSAVMAGVTLFNCFLTTITSYVGQYQAARPFYNCWFTDCLVRPIAYGYYYSSTTLLNNVSGFSSQEPREFNRVVIEESFTAAGSVFNNIGTYGDTTFTDVVKYTSSTGTWYTRSTSAPTLTSLDGLAAGRFTAAGWFDDATLPAARPYFADVINLVVDTLVDGAPTARTLLYEAGGQHYLLGQTDGAGQLDMTLRVRRWLTFKVVATESYALPRLQEGNYVAAGGYYLPPTDSGYKYQASAAGQMSGLAGVTFGASPVVINGVTYSPSPIYPEMATGRTSLLTGGAQQLIILDTASIGGGGGGPVLDGDPAFLDGVVEQVHPMLGTQQPLANTEVVVFERRGESWASMGSSYSNLYGEFRVETDVYGGGDIFAFAADFPGLVWQPGIELGIGSKIRPTVNNGYVYEVITAGNSGAAEPQWWADTGDGTEGAIGGATAKARPYYQPVGHGPLKMTLVE